MKFFIFTRSPRSRENSMEITCIIKFELQYLINGASEVDLWAHRFN